MRRDTQLLAPLRRWGRTSGRLARRGFWPLALVQIALFVAGAYLDILWFLLAGLLLIWPVLAAAARRLHDQGRSAHWLWLLFVPYLGLAVLLLLMAPPLQRPTPYDRPDDRPFGPIAVAVISGLIAAALLAAAPITVTRGGMKPALLPGDRVLVWRFGAGGLARASCWPAACPWAEAPTPAIGTVVAYLHPLTGAPRVGRVMGLPGDELTLRDGLLHRAGAPVPRRRIGTHQERFGPEGPARLLPRCVNGAVGLGALCRKLALAETLPSGREILTLDSGRSRMDNSGPFTVPPGHVFVLSDNRDVAEDSRVAATAGGAGMVPQSAIIGRAARVLFSARGWGGWMVWQWRPGRIMERVR